MFPTKVIEKIKSHILCTVTCPLKFCHLCESVEKYCTARQATGYNVLGHTCFGGPGSVVRITTAYELDGPGIESR